MKVRCHFPLVYHGVKDWIIFLLTYCYTTFLEIQPHYIGSPTSFRLPKPNKKGSQLLSSSNLKLLCFEILQYLESA